MKKAIIILCILLGFAVIAALVFDWGRQPVPFAGGDTVASSTADMPIIVTSPLDGATVTNPIHIRGKARGTWYFEASFPVELVDSAGAILASGPAHAESDWMTSDYVDFTADLTYPATSTGRALLVLKNDNPSGDPDRDVFKFVTVILK